MKQNNHPQKKQSNKDAKPAVKESPYKIEGEINYSEEQKEIGSILAWVRNSIRNAKSAPGYIVDLSDDNIQAFLRYDKRSLRFELQVGDQKTFWSVKQEESLMKAITAQVCGITEDSRDTVVLSFIISTGIGEPMILTPLDKNMKGGIIMTAMGLTDVNRREASLRGVEEVTGLILPTQYFKYSKLWSEGSVNYAAEFFIVTPTKALGARIHEPNAENGIAWVKLSKAEEVIEGWSQVYTEIVKSISVLPKDKE